MFSYHPPEVVTLSRSATGVHTPETESPLSSAPNSPRSSHGMFESSANLLQELLLQEKQAQQQAEQNQLQQKQQILLPEAPFDEAVDVDEKKFDGDELMGQQSPQTQQHHVDILNNDFDHNDDDDESEPPSLAVHRTPKRLDVPFEDPQLIVMMMTTPLQPLPSPPPLIKQTMPWEAAMGSPESAPIREEEATLIDDSQGKFSRVDSNNSNKENPTVQLKQDCQESQNLQEEIDDFDVIAESIPLYERRQFIPAEQDMQEVVPTPQYKERPTLKGHRSISEPVLNDWNKYLKNYRQMTPKRDLSMSEKSAAWLQEEFKRRSTMKQEINNAILGRNNQEISEEVTVKEMIDSLQESLVFVPEDKDDIPAHELQGDFAAALSKALEALPPSSSPDSKVDCSQHSEDDEIVALTTATVVAGDEDGPAPRRLDYEYQQHMQRFVNDTRVALRESETGFRSLATESPPPTEARSPAMSRSSNVTEDSDIDISITPILVHSMDSYLGIAKGDITLSLLNENTYTPQKATWATRVQAAIWRCRGMRRNMGGIPVLSQSPTRSSLPVDMDNARVTGGIRNVQTTQEAALRHLQQDEVEEAMELFEDIIFAYYAYFERTLRAREANLGVQADGITDFRPYIGVALHNLGILNLLKGQYREALSYFGRALDHRKASLGEGHPDHVASLVKFATCMYALNEFADAHAKLEQALVFARKNSQDLGDRMQMAEILNNLGCLAYMCGQPVAANSFFRQSLDVQFAVLSHSLYLSSAAVGQSISLNISILRANIGFVKLVTKEIPMAVSALENALMEQQLLLLGANETLIATMDHLALANLLNGDPQKATMMFDRVLELQQKEYGPHDQRCYVTIDKIKIVKSRGTNFEQAVEELRRTFSMPDEDSIDQSPGKKEKRVSHEQTIQKTKNQKNKVIQVLTSIRKKKPASH